MCSGYNSGDEHTGRKNDLTNEEWAERDRIFKKAMCDQGFLLEDIVEDGACLFRAISLQIYGDQDMHEVIRQQTMDYIVSLIAIQIKGKRKSKISINEQKQLICSSKIVNTLHSL